MALFKDMLGSDERLIRDDVPLSYDYMPKLLKYRETQQRQFAFAIKPLLQERNGRNLFVYGAPGIGKTVACRHVLRELEEETDKVIPIYINCWKSNTAYKILIDICNQLGIRLIANLKTNELFARIRDLINQKSAVFVFDEIDKLVDFDVLYMVLEDIYRKSICLITNYRKKVEELDERIMSRLNPEFIEFKQYNKEETRGILAERMKYAFVENVWDNEAFNFVVDKTFELGDLRKGLFLMKEAGNTAEDRASRKITIADVNKAWNKAQENFIKKNEKEELEDELKNILEIVKQNNGSKIGDLFQKFIENGGEMSYKNFTRKIDKLQEGKLVVTEKVTGKEGNTTLVYAEKKLTEYTKTGEKQL